LKIFQKNNPENYKFLLGCVKSVFQYFPASPITSPSSMATITINKLLLGLDRPLSQRNRHRQIPTGPLSTPLPHEISPDTIIEPRGTKRVQEVGEALNWDEAKPTLNNLLTLIRNGARTCARVQRTGHENADDVFQSQHKASVYMIKYVNIGDTYHAVSLYCNCIYFASIAFLLEPSAATPDCAPSTLVMAAATPARDAQTQTDSTSTSGLGNLAQRFSDQQLTAAAEPVDPNFRVPHQSRNLPKYRELYLKQNPSYAAAQCSPVQARQQDNVNVIQHQHAGDDDGRHLPRNNIITVPESQKEQALSYPRQDANVETSYGNHGGSAAYEAAHKHLSSNPIVISVPLPQEIVVNDATRTPMREPPKGEEVTDTVRTCNLPVIKDAVNKLLAKIRLSAQSAKRVERVGAATCLDMGLNDAGAMYMAQHYHIGGTHHQITVWRNNRVQGSIEIVIYAK